MSRRWQLLIAELTDREHFDDLQFADLLPAALAWLAQDCGDGMPTSKHEFITEQAGVYSLLLDHQLPRFGHEHVGLRQGEHNTAEDALWDIGVGMLTALVKYASDAALRAEWDYAKSESIDPREGLGELMAMRAEDARDRARDMLIEQERAA